MKSVRQLMNDLQQKRFVGREKELALMRQELYSDEGDWRLIHLYGPGGIGKSALLRAFQRTIEGRLAFYMDGRSYLYPTHFTEAVRSLLAEIGFPVGETEDATRLGVAEAEMLNRIADASGGIILLLDSLDSWERVETWLREHWLPLLTLRVKVCSAGRYPSDESLFHSPEWSGIVRNIRLSPLSKNEVDNYTAACGITEWTLQEAIWRFSGGVPLALKLACELTLQHGAQSFLEGTQPRAIIASMDRALFHTEQQSLQCKRFLDAASLLWRFDQDMLEWILDEKIPQELFRQFCSLPYVTICRQGGYWILDAVRRWTKSELEHRAPETYLYYKKRALAAMERRWMTTLSGDTERKKMLRFEKLYLLCDPFKRNNISGDGEGFHIKTAGKDDLPRLGEMFQRMMTSFPPFLPDDTLQHSLLDVAWEAEPAALQVIWHEDQIVGFYAFVPINEKTISIFAGNCTMRTYLENTPRQDAEYIIWLVSSLPDYDSDVIGLIVRDLYCHRISGKLVFITVPLDGTIESICRIGFERLPWADYRSPGGLHFQAARMDLRGDDFFNRIPLTDHGNVNKANASEDRILLIKRVLESYHTLKLESSLLGTISCLLPGKPLGLSDETAANRITSHAVMSLERLARGKNHEQMQERILRLFYIERIGPHETVASRLGLPMTTYYRYLKKGLSQLSDDMFADLAK